MGHPDFWGAALDARSSVLDDGKRCLVAWEQVRAAPVCCSIGKLSGSWAESRASSTTVKIRSKPDRQREGCSLMRWRQAQAAVQKYLIANMHRTTKNLSSVKFPEAPKASSSLPVAMSQRCPSIPTPRQHLQHDCFRLSLHAPDLDSDSDSISNTFDSVQLCQQSSEHEPSCLWTLARSGKQS